MKRTILSAQMTHSYGISLRTHVLKLTSSVHPPTQVDESISKILITTAFDGPVSELPNMSQLATVLVEWSGIYLLLQLVPFEAVTLLDQFQYTGIATSPPPQLQKLAAWLSLQATKVFSRLSKHDPALASTVIDEGNWLDTGTCYGLPQIHTHCVYTKLKYDTQALD
ncbi:hypothetical protein BS17DRAFT_767830 [Gyrodon lividus]|nr:hypothetical protein BS17DRAFT_767830 [Gyrodon lividus]